MVLLIYAVVLVVYAVCPVYVQLIMFVANMFIPDAVPYIDEAIMVITTLAQLKEGE